MTDSGRTASAGPDVPIAIHAGTGPPPSGGSMVDASAILLALRDVGACIEGFRRAVAAELGLVTADIVAIGLLHKDEPLRAGQIGERIGLTPSSVTALLDRLETRGYLTRARLEHDRRSLQVSLTRTGRALGDALVAALLPTLGAIAAEIGPTGTAGLIDALERITTGLAAVAVDPSSMRRLGDTDPASV